MAARNFSASSLAEPRWFSARHAILINVHISMLPGGISKSFIRYCENQYPLTLILGCSFQNLDVFPSGELSDCTPTCENPKNKAEMSAELSSRIWMGVLNHVYTLAGTRDVHVPVPGVPLDLAWSTFFVVSMIGCLEQFRSLKLSARQKVSD